MAEEKNNATWYEKLSALDRRVIFLLIALAVIIPLIVHYTTTIPPSQLVLDLYNAVENLPPGSKVLMSFDYGPSTAPENQPMAVAMARHCFEKGHKVYMIALWATGPRQSQQLIDELINVEFPDKVHGEDYLHLGYKAGNQGLINALLSDFKSMYSSDLAGVDIESFPMMEGIENLRDFDIILAIGSGFPGTKEWVQFAGDPGDIPVGGGTTAVMAPLLYPYYPKQMLGFLGGLQGAAEYEAALMIGYPKYADMTRQASTTMGPQVTAHLVIVGFILIGNLTYLMEKRKKRKF